MVARSLQSVFLEPYDNSFSHGLSSGDPVSRQWQAVHQTDRRVGEAYGTGSSGSRRSLELASNRNSGFYCSAIPTAINMKPSSTQVYDMAKAPLDHEGILRQ
jgi:hypothetical protein